MWLLSFLWIKAFWNSSNALNDISSENIETWVSLPTLWEFFFYWFNNETDQTCNKFKGYLWNVSIFIDVQLKQNNNNKKKSKQ